MSRNMLGKLAMAVLIAICMDGFWAMPAAGSGQGMAIPAQMEQTKMWSAQTGQTMTWSGQTGQGKALSAQTEQTITLPVRTERAMTLPAQTEQTITLPAYAQVYEKEAYAKDKVTLSFVGDISFAEGYANVVHYHSAGDNLEECIMPEILTRMDQADIMMVNNEFAYSNRGKPLDGKTFTFHAKPETASSLVKMSADIVSLANNHVYDYGATALVDTMDTLDQYGMPYVGAGRNLDEAKKIVYFKVNDMTIAYVSATQVERSYVYTKEATRQRQTRRVLCFLEQISLGVSIDGDGVIREIVQE